MTSSPATPGRMPPGEDDPVVRALRGWLAAGHVGPDATLVVACSGGADSLALAAAARSVSDSRRVAAAIVDHGLQPGSAAVARTTAETLRRWGFADVAVLAVDVTGGGGPEAAARAARYRALRRHAAGFGAGTAVLLAHTADDQAETVLLGLARGSGPRSIAGMRPWREPWGRPLLAVRRADTENTCAAVGIEPWRDPHNSDPAFTRVRLRREVLPLMDEVLGGGVVPALARTAELMADDLAALDGLADRAFRSCAAGAELDCDGLADWPRAVRRRVLRTWLHEAGGLTGLTYRHLARLEDIVIHGYDGQSVRLPGAIDAVRSGRRMVLRAAAPGR